MSAAEPFPGPEAAADAAAGSFPLTEAQSGLWYSQRIDPASPILNCGQYLEIIGPLDRDCLRRAVDQVAAECDAFTLRFVDTADGPRQAFDSGLRPRLQSFDLSGAADPEAEALSAIRRDTSTPIDLGQGPLAAFHLYRLDAERHFFYERIHHLAIDGFGIVLFTNRVAQVYSALRDGAATGQPFPSVRRAFEEDDAYRAAARRQVDRDYWHSELAGLGEIGALAPGRPVSAHDFRRETVRLDAERMARLRAVADAAGVTWPDALTALVAAYCHRLYGTRETVVGVPHMGRLGNAAARVPCMLMNVLPLRLAPDEDAPLADFLVGVSRKLIAMRRHGRYRSELLRRELGLVGGNRRLYGPLVNVQPFDLPPAMSSLDVRLHILGAGSVDDLTFTFRGDARRDLVFEVDSNPDLYSAEDTQAHAQRLLAFLDAAAGAASLADIATTGPAETHRLVAGLNATAHPVRDVTLVELIEEAIARTPDATALVFGAQRLTYRELDRRSAALAARLAGMGAGRDKVVAVALPRSIELVVALVAVLRSGAAYLPLDLDHPAARLQQIVRSASPAVVLTTPEHVALFGDTAPLLATPDWDAVGRQALEHSRPGDMAYVIYTSGSTGEPKGVVVEHRAIVNRLEWMRTYYGFGADERILQKTPTTFDVSVWEFFLPLICGATLVVAPPGAHRDPAAIAALIRAERITTCHFVPSMLSAFLACPDAAGLKLRRVFCSGEELTASQRDRFHHTLQAELHNLYGPTEAAVDVSSWPAAPDDVSQPVPIGFPVWNTQLYVLDERLRPVPAGIVGHLYIGGVQLARGYLGRPDLTAERFIDDPFNPGGRLYRTGDLARRRRDGAIVFLGRSDHQVKIRGLRIELGEIEAALMAAQGVREAGVVAREDRPGDRRIVAYVVPAEAGDAERLRRHLAARLPDYMIPAAFVGLGALPVTANGKLDRAALPAPHYGSAGGRAAATPTEAALCALVAEVLGLAQPPAADDDFFALGGDSLSAVNLMLACRETFGRDPGLGAVFGQPSIAALAAAIDAGAIDAPGAAEERSGLGPVIRLGGSGSDLPPLFIVHPAGGIAWCYRRLAGRLSAQRPVYGLQAPALQGEHLSPASLETLAADYVQRIRALRPEGPYHLAGWSVGGIIAQAMAVRLRELGASVGLVALLDSYPSDCWRAEPEPTPIQALRALIAIAGEDPAAHPELTTRPAIKAFLRRSGGALGKLPDAALDGVIRVVCDTNRLVRGHFHRPFDGTLTHVRAALDHEGRNLVADLWRPYAAGLDTVAVPFLHQQLVGEEAAVLISAALEPRLVRYDDCPQEGN